ncbi:Lrp/AsnC family transcriptional regulator [Acetobacter ghanensis]|uniref:AsnC family transcriptional regulator n=1 Tax=Acetobacter ghanensis TaxID=431306 RepID=A0A0U5F641_9PROT|nr:Lrp/AsnC family transcriptional regulator [Acetobacter ghanensis]NHO38799.1 AsnC family transcriptional regulator [Acetobacter ghanensis]GBQ51697.1 AsnC family transcriptional regulator [Acetobacter ghanensis DSM 18895]CEF57237.1 AsnC family transcriptional regulator [Acetobacter ghanensis]
MENCLDKTDRQILRLLQNNGRIHNAELADKVQLSPATCHRRVQRLFDEGYISSVRATVNASRVGLGMVVLVGVVLERTANSFPAFEAAMAEQPAVLDCYLVAGDFDYFLKIRVKDMEGFDQFHADVLSTLPHVRQTRTFFVLRAVADAREYAF